ncbi:unnamed protein product [Linum trigynum]|uniref:Uncharacterized protein n=1 Tax=Linum trigynum TaxID=586398 RepID=A0AAV2ET19_9ROSI
MVRTKTTKRKQRPTPRQPPPLPQPDENEEEENVEVEEEGAAKEAAEVESGGSAEEDAEAEVEGAEQGTARGQSKARDKLTVKRRRQNPSPSPPPQLEEDEEEEDAELAAQVRAQARVPQAHVLGQGKPWYRFWCHTKSLLDVIKYWKEEPRYYEACKKELEKAGFGGLLELRLANVPKKLFDSLMAQFDVQTHSFIFGEGDNKKVLTIEAEDVARVYGLPIGGAEIDVVKSNDKMLEMFKEELNMECTRSQNVEVMDLREEACGGPDDAPKRRPPVSAAVKQFLLLALGSMLAPKMSRLCDLDYAEYMVGRMEDIATFNWSGFVSRNLKFELGRVKENEAEARARGKQQWPLGDIHFLMIHLLDFLNVRGFATKTIPTCSYWFDPRVDKVCSNIPKVADKYIMGPMLLSREEVSVSANMSWESGSSSSAPATDWWADVDLESLEDDELKALESLTEKVMDVWETRRDSIWRVVIMRHQGNN